MHVLMLFHLGKLGECRPQALGTCGFRAAQLVLLLVRQGNELLLRMDARLAVDVADMRLGGVHRHEKLLAHALRVHTLGDQPQNRHFGGGELVLLGQRVEGFARGCACLPRTRQTR